MNLLDLLLLALCAGLGILGIFQGIVRQVSSWTGLVLGHLLGARYHGPVQKTLGFSFLHAEVVTYLLVFLAVYVAARLLGLLVERLVRDTKLSGTDRFAGALAGFAKGVLLSVLLVFLLVVLLPRDTPFLRGSKLAPQAITAARWISKVFPRRFEDAFREKTGKAEAPPSTLPKRPSGK